MTTPMTAATPSDVGMEPESNIVERLRKQAGYHIDNQKMVSGQLFDEAADEIERLRRASDPLRGGMVEALRDANGALCDANNRILELEKALQVIEAGKVRRTDPLEAYSLAVEDFARAALTKAESLNAEGSPAK